MSRLPQIVVGQFPGARPRRMRRDDFSRRLARETVLTTADLSASINGPFGPMPAADLLGRLVANDVLVHTWDLARAVGGDERLDEEMVRGAYSGMKPMDEMIRRPGVFGPKITVDGADVQTEFLSFLGRTV